MLRSHDVFVTSGSPNINIYLGKFIYIAIRLIYKRVWNKKNVKHWPSLQVMLAKHTRACSSESALPNLSGDSCWHNYLHQRHGYYWTVMLDKIENIYIYIIHIIWLVSGLPSKTSSISNIDSIHVSFVVSVPLPLGGRTSIRLDLPSESLITRMIMARWVAQLVLREDKNLDILGPLEKHWYHPITGHSYLSHMLCANLFSE